MFLEVSIDDILKFLNINISLSGLSFFKCFYQYIPIDKTAHMTIFVIMLLNILIFLSQNSIYHGKKISSHPWGIPLKTILL